MPKNAVLDSQNTETCSIFIASIWAWKSDGLYSMKQNKAKLYNYAGVLHVYSCFHKQHEVI